MAVNKTIGLVKCPFTSELSEVRENKNGKLYYVGAAGQITPNRPAGQQWLASNMQPLNETEQESINSQPTELGQRKISDPEPVSVNDKLADKKPKTEEEKQSNWGFF